MKYDDIRGWTARIDSRDVDEAITELFGDIDQEDIEEETDGKFGYNTDIAAISPEDLFSEFSNWLEGYGVDPVAVTGIEDLQALCELRAEVISNSNQREWDSGICLVNEDEVSEYFKEMCEELGDIPASVIDFVDWDAYAEYCLTDYSEVDFDGATFYFRSF